MTVFPCKTKVKVGSLEGVITAINIRCDRVCYEVSYWSGDSHNCKYFEDYEVEPVTKERQKIGFK